MSGGWRSFGAEDAAFAERKRRGIGGGSDGRNAALVSCDAAEVGVCGEEFDGGSGVVGFHVRVPF